MRLLRFLIAASALMTFITPAGAERLVSVVTDKLVSIDSTFSGETLSMFGNVEPDLDSGRRYVDGPFDVIVVIQGPAQDRVARRKTRELGVWINTDQLAFKNIPSFFWVLSSDKLNDIATPELLAEEGILPQSRPQLTVVQGGGDPLVFGTELVRLMTEMGLYGINESGVHFQSETLYSAQVSLPADVPNGNFLARTYLFKGGGIVSQRAEGFSVRKTGFEQFLNNAARQSPWAYGFACVIVAIFTGWLGGVAFRR
jgi:uncharacterized protein (TIGR02186 family)